MREADARIPMLAHHCIVVTIEAIKAEPATEPVERKRISIKGYPVADLMAASTSLRLNSVAINIPNPKQPLMKRVVIIDLGMTRDAFWISSDIYPKN